MASSLSLNNWTYAAGLVLSDLSVPAVGGYDGGTAVGPGNPTFYQGSSNTDNQNVGGSFNFAFDGNGNQTYPQAVGHPHLYDPENRVISYFVYDGDKAVLVLYTDGSVLDTTTFGANGLLPSHQSYAPSVFTR